MAPEAGLGFIANGLHGCMDKLRCPVRKLWLPVAMHVEELSLTAIFLLQRPSTCPVRAGPCSTRPLASATGEHLWLGPRCCCGCGRHATVAPMCPCVQHRAAALPYRQASVVPLVTYAHPHPTMQASQRAVPAHHLLCEAAHHGDCGLPRGDGPQWPPCQQHPPAAAALGYRHRAARLSGAFRGCMRRAGRASVPALGGSSSAGALRCPFSRGAREHEQGRIDWTLPRRRRSIRRPPQAPPKASVFRQSS